MSGYGKCMIAMVWLMVGVGAAEAGQTPCGRRRR